MSVPLAAIFGRTYIRVKRIQAENGGLSKTEKLALQESLGKQMDLQQRVEALENIIISMDKEILSLHGYTHELHKSPQEQVKRLSHELRNQIAVTKQNGQVTQS
jgi:hypothetical protein